VSSLTVGDALDPATQIGPLVSERQRDRVESYIAKGISDGARLTTGGNRPHDLSRGWFVAPTVFADVDNASTIAQEEIFGPTLAVIEYRDEADGITIANTSNYGLGGSVWTEDRQRGIDVARQIQTGSVGLIGSPPDLGAPFGGWKESGLGREFGPEGLGPYLAYQSIYLPPGRELSRGLHTR
jgi:acyl-CoA reductase-like NAD-dependent aldehyde dehydrogenase